MNPQQPYGPENQDSTSNENITAPINQSPIVPPEAPAAAPVTTTPQPITPPINPATNYQSTIVTPSSSQPETGTPSFNTADSTVSNTADSTASVVQPIISPQPLPGLPSNPQQVMLGSAVQESSSHKFLGHKKLLVSLIVLVVVIAAAGLSWFYLKPMTGNSSKSISVTVPANWKAFNTGLGYSVEGPSTWGLGFKSTSTVENINETSINLSATGGVINYSSTTGASTTQSQINDSVNLSTEELTSNNTQANFVKAVSTLTSQEKELLKMLGMNPNSEKVTSNNLSINGKTWLNVMSSGNGESTAYLYYWDNNHAVSLSANNASQQVVNQLYKTYLLPMAASMKLKA